MKCVAEIILFFNFNFKCIIFGFLHVKFDFISSDTKRSPPQREIRYKRHQTIHVLKQKVSMDNPLYMDYGMLCYFYGNLNVSHYFISIDALNAGGRSKHTTIAL